jgi:predicted membrane GTPase involved in stress response
MEGKGSMVIKFNIPSLGLRNQLLTATAGEAIMSHRFIGYEPFKEQFLEETMVHLNGKWKSNSLFYR